MAMGPMVSGTDADAVPLGGLRGRLPQCQFMTSAVHERRPHRPGGATLVAGSGTADGVAYASYGPRSTEHTYGAVRNRCAHPSMVMVLVLRQTAEGRRLGRLMKHRHCTQQTNDNESQDPASRRWGRREGGRWLRQGLGTWSGWLDVSRYLATSPGCMHCASAVLCHSLILRLPLPSLDFGFANSNFGPHPDIPDLAFPAVVCLSLSAILPSFSCTLSSRLFRASVCPLCLPRGALSCFPAVAEY